MNWYNLMQYGKCIGGTFAFSEEEAKVFFSLDEFGDLNKLPIDSYIIMD